MSDSANKALLPAGMRDVLPPEAEFESRVVARLMSCFASYGYERVKPPLIEFEDSLLVGGGADMSSQTLRLMDPDSRRVVALRADMTVQVARIAATRLKKAPRPLRLSYAGEVLRVKGSQLRPERQFGQVGVELIGASGSAADSEVVLMAVEALGSLGVADLSVDLGLPGLVRAVCAELDLDDEAEARLRTALDHKDAAAVADLADALGQETVEILSAMVAAGGPAGETLEDLMGLELSPRAAAERASLARVVDKIRAGAPDLALTVDPVENRGFEYHTGVTFTYFARGVRGELGSGGRYTAGAGFDGGEPATGLTLFTDTVLRALAPETAPPRVYVCADAAIEEARRLRAEGWVTVQEIEKAADAAVEARRLGCSHVLADGKLRDIS